MHASEHSRTAEFMALFRALETARDPTTRLFNDPWAAGFLSRKFRLVTRLARWPFGASLLAHVIDRRWPGARSSGVARTRYIDDTIIRALGTGIDQIVLLGAGFDCRPYRLHGMGKAQVFEVDHPNTSRAKQARLQAVLGRLPASVRFVALDFNRQSLDQGLREAGLDLARPVFFLWEGVTQYLDAAAVDATFRYVSAAAPGSQILFTYVDRRVLEPESGYAGIEAISSALANAAEPWIFGFDPAGLPHYLEARRLDLVSDLGAAAYRALYLERADRLRGYEFYRVALADITGRKAGAAADRNDSRAEHQAHA